MLPRHCLTPPDSCLQSGEGQGPQPLPTKEAAFEEFAAHIEAGLGEVMRRLEKKVGRQREGHCTRTTFWAYEHAIHRRMGRLVHFIMAIFPLSVEQLPDTHEPT
jgi:hypothetical protein